MTFHSRLDKKTFTRGRIREKYNPNPTAREKAYHHWLMEQFPCSCGCGGRATVVHHVLGRHSAKRWRRDHLMTVPMTASCHMDLHGGGDEASFRDGVDFPALAFDLQTTAYHEGIL